MADRDLIVGYTEEAKQQLHRAIDKAEISGRRSCNFNLTGIVPEEYLYSVMGLLKSRMRKLGYKFKQVGIILTVSW